LVLFGNPAPLRTNIHKKTLKQNKEMLVKKTMTNLSVSTKKIIT
jgi:hypothetical protein